MLSRGPCSMSFAVTIWLFSKSAILWRLRNPCKIKRLFTQQIDTKCWMRRSLLSLYKSKLEVTSIENNQFPEKKGDNVPRHSNISKFGHWFQILSWNHQLEPLTTFRTRTVGLTTSLSSCFYTIRLEWHLDNWANHVTAFDFEYDLYVFHIKMPESVCISLDIYTVYISVYKYTYIHVYVCKSMMHPYTGIPIHKYV